MRLLTGRERRRADRARGASWKSWRPAGQTPVTRQLGFVALIAADGGVDKAWALASKSAGSLRDLVDAMPLIRDPGQRAASIPRSCRCSTACRRNWRRQPRRRRGPRAATSGSSCRARRTLTLAEVEVYSDGRNVARAGQGHAEEHRLRRRRRAGDRRQQERRLRRRRPDAHRGEHRESLVGGRSRRRVPDRLDRRLQPHRRRPRQAARRLHAQGARRRAARSSSRPTNLPAPSETATTEVGGDRAGGAAPPRGDDRADLGPRQGGRDLQGPRASSSGRRRRPRRRDPGVCSASRSPTGRRKRPARCSTPCSPTSARSRRRSGPRASALDALQLADSLAALLPLDRGQAGPPASWASWACG